MIVAKKKSVAAGPSPGQSQVQTFEPAAANNDGTWDILLTFVDASLADELKIEFKNDSTNAVLYGAEFNIGDDMQTATPIVDNGWVANVQPYLSSFVADDGESGRFPKRVWADATGNNFDNAIVIRVEVSLRIAPGAYGVVNSDTMTILSRNGSIDTTAMVVSQDGNAIIWPSGLDTVISIISNRWCKHW